MSRRAQSFLTVSLLSLVLVGALSGQAAPSRAVGPVSPRGQMECNIFSTPVAQHQSGVPQLIVSKKTDLFELGFETLEVKLPAPFAGVSVRFMQTLGSWPESGGELKPYLQSYFVRNGLPEAGKRDAQFELGASSSLGSLILRDTLTMPDATVLSYQCILHLVK